VKRRAHWLDRAAVLAIQEALLAEHGGLAGLRDEGLLDSALASAQHTARYQKDADLPALAARYASAIIRNHPFLDGNKRTAFVAAAVFLEINGWSLSAPEAEVVALVEGLAARETTEATFAEWLRRSIRKKRSRRQI
jgi:death-on-curing protein